MFANYYYVNKNKRTKVTIAIFCLLSHMAKVIFTLHDTL